jgi:hypothetical protein
MLTLRASRRSPTAPAPAPLKSFGDWAVACDNLRLCEMTSLIGDEGDWPEDGPLAASIAARPGPQGGFDDRGRFVQGDAAGALA